MARVTWQGWLALQLSALPLAPWAGDTARFWGMHCPEIPHLKPWGSVSVWGLRGGRGQRAPAPGVQAAWVRQLGDLSGCWVLPHLPGCFLGEI